MAKHLNVGRHAVEAPCPSCGVIELIWADLSTVLTTPADDDPTLRLRLKAKPVVHQCGQETISDLFAQQGVSVEVTPGETR